MSQVDQNKRAEPYATATRYTAQMALAAVPRATPRRVTRSQSREVEDSTTNNVLASKDARQQDDGLGKASSSRECHFPCGVLNLGDHARNTATYIHLLCFFLYFLLSSSVNNVLLSDDLTASVLGFSHLEITVDYFHLLPCCSSHSAFANSRWLKQTDLLRAEHGE